MQEIKIINHITVSGKTMLWNEIPEQDRKALSDKIQENFMRLAGYERRTS